MAKFISVTALIAGSFALSFIGMIYGWGLEAENWWYIIGTMSGSVVFSGVAQSILKD